MRNLFILLALIFLTLPDQTVLAQVDRSSYPEPGPAPEIQMGEAHTFTLENGLKVFVVENKKLPRVAFSLILERDPILEGGKVGMLDFVGDMMMGGTSNRSKDELDDAIDFIGASLSASSSSLYASSLKKHQDSILELMADVLFNPVFPEQELEKLRKQALTALAQSKDNPNSISARLTSALNYGKDHPYGETKTEQTLNNIQVEDIRSYYKTYFKPNISYLAIVGDITPEEAEPLVKKYFSQWQQGEVPSHEYETPTPPDTNKVALVDRPASVQSVVRITYPVIMRLDHPDYLVTRALNTVLGGGTSSRLFQNLREDKGYTYGANSSFGSDKLIASFTAYADVKQTATDSAITEMIHEIRNLAENGVTEKELDIAKATIGGSFGRSLEQPSTIASFAINAERYGLADDFYTSYLQRLNAITVEDVNEAARKYLKPENLYITVVGNASEIQEKLAAFGEVQKFTNMADPQRELELGDVDISAEQVIDNYLQAIGGREAANAIERAKMEMSAEIQGTKLNMIVLYDAPEQRMAQRMLMMGNEASKTLIKDGKATLSAMGQSQTLSDEQFEDMKMSMWIIPELHYELMGYSMELDGLREIDGQEAYKIDVTNPTGGKITHYYSVDSGMKLKTESQIEGETSYLKYETFEGVKLPVEISLQSPMIPFPIDSKLEDIEINPTFTEEDFN
jgi:zinc protease